MADPWYTDGLRFTCTQCGNCCGGAPGYVWVDEREISALAVRLGLEEAVFRQRYTRKVRGRGVTLVEKPGKKGVDCIFYDRTSGCTVYPDRPKQCRTWPFWRPLIETQAGWEAAASGCPGMDVGTLHSADKITATAADDGLA